MNKNFSVTKDGKPLDPALYSWDEKTKTFSTEEDGLVLDFRDFSSYTFKTGSYCTFKTGSYCTFKTGYGCTFDTGYGCTFDTGSYCTFKTGPDCTFDTGYDCTFDTGYGCTFDTGSYCTFDTGYGCTFDTGYGCTFDTGYGCTFKTGYGCTFKTGEDCTFKTGPDCTFDTGYGCTFDTGYGCTFDTGYGCTFKTGYGCTFDTGSESVIVRRDKFQVIVPGEDGIIKLCPMGVPGYISKKQDEDAFYMDIDGERIEHVIVDGILSKVVKKRGNVMHVVNHGEENVSYIVRDGDKYSHGATLEEAKDNLKYKLSTRDKSKYEAYTIDTELTLAESIEMYRVITGACEPGTRYFIEQILSPERKADPKPYTVSEVIELTKGQYNHSELVKFFERRDDD